MKLPPHNGARLRGRGRPRSITTPQLLKPENKRQMHNKEINQRQDGNKKQDKKENNDNEKCHRNKDRNESSSGQDKQIKGKK